MIEILKKVKEHCEKRGMKSCEGCCFYKGGDCDATELGIFDSEI